MPSVSEPQQHLMGMAYAYKTGQSKHASPEVKRVASGMSKGQLHDFAATRGLAFGGMVRSGIGVPHGLGHSASVIPKGHLIPPMSSGIGAVKPMGLGSTTAPDRWVERSEASGMAHAAPIPMQDGGTSPWYEHQEARNEIDMPHGGFLNSSLAGRTDRLPLAVAADSFVMPADVVSGLGQSNTLSGRNVLQSALRIGPYASAHPAVTHGSGPPRAPGIPGEVEREMFGYAKGGEVEKGVSHTLMAGGEFVIPPHDWTDGHSIYRGVKSIGDGDVDEGHRRLRKMVSHVRKHVMEFLKNAPAPKR